MLKASNEKNVHTSIHQNLYPEKTKMDGEKEFWDQRGLWNGCDDEYYRERRRIIQSLIPEDAREILDVGCGNGTITNFLLDKGWRIIGLDKSKEALRHLKAPHIQGDCTDLPFKKDSFDVIILTEVLEHLRNHALKKTIVEVNRVAGRYLLLGVPFREALSQKYVKCPKCGYVFNTDTHCQTFRSVRSIEKIFKEFQLKTQVFCGHPTAYSNRFLLFILRRVFSIWSDWTENTLCINCANSIRPTVKPNIFQTLIDSLEKVVCSLKKKQPYWFIGLMERKGGFFSQEGLNVFDHQDPATTHANYLKWHDTAYDKVKNSSIEKMFPALEGKTALDAGCGGGLFSILMAKKGAKVYGVDRSRYSIAGAVHYAKEEGLSHKCKFICQNVEAIQFGETFNFVLAKDIIEHLHNDMDFLIKLYGCLKRDGHLLIVTQNSCSSNFLVEGFWRRIIRGEKWWMGWDETHVRFYNYWNLKRKLEKSGFEVVGSSGCYYFPLRLFSNLGWNLDREKFYFLDRKIGDFFPVSIVGWSMAILCKKVEGHYGEKS